MMNHSQPIFIDNLLFDHSTGLKILKKKYKDVCPNPELKDIWDSIIPYGQLNINTAISNNSQLFNITENENPREKVKLLFQHYTAKELLHDVQIIDFNWELINVISCRKAQEVFDKTTNSIKMVIVQEVYKLYKLHNEQYKNIFDFYITTCTDDLTNYTVYTASQIQYLRTFPKLHPAIYAFYKNVNIPSVFVLHTGSTVILNKRLILKIIRHKEHIFIQANRHCPLTNEIFISESEDIKISSGHAPLTEAASIEETDIIHLCGLTHIEHIL